MTPRPSCKPLGQVPSPSDKREKQVQRSQGPTVSVRSRDQGLSVSETTHLSLPATQILPGVDSGPQDPLNRKLVKGTMDGALSAPQACTKPFVRINSILPRNVMKQVHFLIPLYPVGPLSHRGQATRPGSQKQEAQRPGRDWGGLRSAAEGPGLAVSSLVAPPGPGGSI